MKNIILILFSVLLSNHALAGSQCSREAERKGCRTKSHTVCHRKTGDCTTSTWCACPNPAMRGSNEVFRLLESSLNAGEEPEADGDMFEYVE
jgi:hypothetical protein